ncbi:hypothetical protein C0991_011228, partial [Blastosporella zonata]
MADTIVELGSTLFPGDPARPPPSSLVQEEDDPYDADDEDEDDDDEINEHGGDPDGEPDEPLDGCNVDDLPLPTPTVKR